MRRECKLEAAAEGDRGNGGDGRDREGGKSREGRAEKGQKGFRPADKRGFSQDTRQRGAQRCWGGPYSSEENPLLSFRSAPAQKELSTALATISALVGPLSSGPATPPNRLVQLLAGSSSPVDASY